MAFCGHTRCKASPSSQHAHAVPHWGRIALPQCPTHGGVQRLAPFFDVVQLAVEQERLQREDRIVRLGLDKLPPRMGIATRMDEAIRFLSRTSFSWCHPQEADLHLVRKPKRPKWRPFVEVNLGLPHHDSWKHFLDLAYWNVELGEEVE